MNEAARVKWGGKLELEGFRFRVAADASTPQADCPGHRLGRVYRSFPKSRRSVAVRGILDMTCACRPMRRSRS